MKIGEVAQQVGVAVSTLRMYEQRGLIVAGRSPRGTRHYGEEELARFQAIIGLIQAEVPIETLAQLASIRLSSPTGDSASQQVEAMLKDMAAQLTARIEILQSTLADLHDAQDRLTQCHGCSIQPTRENCAACPVADKLLACSVMRVVWDQANHGT